MTRRAVCRFFASALRLRACVWVRECGFVWIRVFRWRFRMAPRLVEFHPSALAFSQ